MHTLAETVQEPSDAAGSALGLQDLQQARPAEPPDSPIALLDQDQNGTAEHAAEEDSKRPFTKDVETVANSYFQKVYADQETVAGLVQKMQAFKGSAVSQEKDVYMCMVHNLFDEYRFFPKYPEKELRITGMLFGQLIRYDLLPPPTALSTALHHVFDSLRHAAGTKMFMFGMTALDQIKWRLHEWPPYCEFLLQLPHVLEGSPELVELVRSAPSLQQQQHGLQ